MGRKFYFFNFLFYIGIGFPGGSDSKESANNAGGLGLIPGLGRSPGEGNGYPLQYFFFFFWGYFLYNIVVVFAIHWHESAVGVHVSPILKPPPTSSPSHPLGLSQCTSFECPVSCIKLGLVIYFIYGNMHGSILFSQIIPPSPSPPESKRLFFISVILLLSCI